MGSEHIGQPLNWFLKMLTTTIQLFRQQTNAKYTARNSEHIGRERMGAPFRTTLYQPPPVKGHKVQLRGCFMVEQHRQTLRATKWRTNHLRSRFLQISFRTFKEHLNFSNPFWSLAGPTLLVAIWVMPASIFFELESAELKQANAKRKLCGVTECILDPPRKMQSARRGGCIIDPDKIQHKIQFTR